MILVVKGAQVAAGVFSFQFLSLTATKFFPKQILLDGGSWLALGIWPSRDDGRGPIKI